MKKLAILCAAFIFVALFTISGVAQENASNPPAKSEDSKKDDKNPFLTPWDVTIAAPGQELPGKFKIEKDGEGYKGSVTTAMGEAPLKNIKIKDNTFTADISVNAQGQQFEGTMSGKVEAEKLSGEINLPGVGSIPYTGKKPENK